MMKLFNIIERLQDIADKHGDMDFITEAYESHNMDDSILANDLMEIKVENDNDGSGDLCCMYVETSKSDRKQQS